MNRANTAFIDYDDEAMDSSLLSTAFALAAKIHARQRRKGSTAPYLGHLMAVAELVWRYEGTDAEACAALLHDAVEDGGGAPVLRLIGDTCGDGIAAIVLACSDSTADTSSGQEKEEWWPRKERYIDHLRCADLPDGTLLVSACDKLQNLSATVEDYEEIGEAVWDRFKTGWAGQVWYYNRLIGVYENCPDNRAKRVAERLREQLDRLESDLRAAGHDPDRAMPSSSA